MAIPRLFSSPAVWPLRRSCPASEPVSASSRFNDALRLMEEGRSTAAFRIFSALANDGHGPAARIALAMATRGTALFGGRYPSTRGERERWQRSVA
jgi:hypothetical protein